jgi:hypothetical protein
MAPTSLTLAKSDLYSRLCTDTSTGSPHSSLTAFTKIYNYEPMPGDIAKPISLTILTATVDSDWFRFAVRIYSGDGTQLIAQTNLDTAIDQFEARMNAEFGPSNWDLQWIDEIAAWVAVSEITVGRQDNQ